MNKYRKRREARACHFEIHVIRDVEKISNIKGGGFIVLTINSTKMMVSRTRNKRKCQNKKVKGISCRPRFLFFHSSTAKLQNYE